MGHFKRFKTRRARVDVFDNGLLPQIVVDFGRHPTDAAVRLMARLRIPEGDSMGEYILNADQFDGPVVDAAADIFSQIRFLHGYTPESNKFSVSEKAEGGNFQKIVMQTKCPDYDLSDLAAPPAPDESPLFYTRLLPHQKDAVEFAATRKVAALFMEMGTGKTRCALELFARRLARGECARCLWLCPCSVRCATRDQIREHAFAEIADRVTVRGIESLSTSSRIQGECEKLVKDGQCFLVIDESLLIKNFSALRTQATIDLAYPCTFKLLLNGTPISRDAGDLYGQFYALDWRIIGFRDEDTYRRRHVMHMPGGRAIILHPDELLDKAARFSFVLKKSDCLALPEKRHKTVKFDMPNDQMLEYRRVRALYCAEERIKTGGPTAIYTAFNALQHVTCGAAVCSVPNVRFSIAKRDEWLDRRLATLASALPDGEQALIFCRYRMDAEHIQARFGGVVLRGGMPAKERVAVLDDFRAGRARYLIALKSAGGFGLNLQFCRNVVYFSNDFDLATRLQSEDRCHRLGQTRNVNIVDIVARDTIDEVIADCMSHKQSISDFVKNAISTGDLGKLWTTKN